MNWLELQQVDKNTVYFPTNTHDVLSTKPFMLLLTPINTSESRLYKEETIIIDTTVGSVI